jgi:hypothetical protein
MMNTASTRPVKKPTAESETHPDLPPTREPAGLRGILPWWTLALGAVLALVIVAVVWVAIYTAPLPTLPAEAVAPYFTVFPPPSLTPIPPTPTLTPFYTPTIALPTVMPGTIGIGAMVEATEDGLRLRDAPSLQGRILTQASAHELFTVVDGPRSADGYTWWLLQGVYDTTRQGWAVENYLQPQS